MTRKPHDSFSSSSSSLHGRVRRSNVFNVQQSRQAPPPAAAAGGAAAGAAGVLLLVGACWLIVAGTMIPSAILLLRTSNKYGRCW